MSTLQHTQQAIRSHTVLTAALVALVAAAAITVVLVLAGGSGSNSPASTPQFGSYTPKGTPAQQLEAVSGARHGITRMRTELTR